MKTFFSIILGLIALFFGGCSLLFSGLILTDGGPPDLLLIWLSGFAIAGLCIWAIVGINRRQ